MKRGVDIVRELNAWNDKNEKDGFSKRIQALRKLLLSTTKNAADIDDDDWSLAKPLVKIADSHFVNILELLPQSLDQKYLRGTFLSGQAIPAVVVF